MRAHADRIPLLSSYGKSVDFGSTAYDKSDEKLVIEYSIVATDPDERASDTNGLGQNNREPLTNVAEKAGFERAIELKLPVNQGWDVQVVVNGQGEAVDETWTSTAEKAQFASRTTLLIHHAPLMGIQQIVKVRVTVQRLAGGNALRVNQKAIKVIVMESNNAAPPQSALINDTLSTSDLSLETGQTEDSNLTHDELSTKNNSLLIPTSSIPSVSQLTPIFRRPNPATRAHVISSLLRRSYIYFSSLLQEPEAKWKQITDSRGVTVTQLQSIDPTLTVFRAEATFVGIGVWNVYSAINTIGARLCWDSSLTNAELLEDLNDLSTLWQIKQKGAWPVAPRDAILITTTYKSPASVHIFSISTDDSNLFPCIKPPDAGHIRTRTEILGWSIEALSPTTTQITLIGTFICLIFLGISVNRNVVIANPSARLGSSMKDPDRLGVSLIDQHDPMGWSPKSWTPAQLIAQVAGVGEYAMKSGGPPIITRVLGAKVGLSRFEHDKGIFRAEYSTGEGCLSSAMQDPTCSDTLAVDLSDVAVVECEIRCDCEIWAASLDIVVDPPPSKATCLKRHKLSSGGGWWVMIEHDAALLAQESARISIRRGSSKKEKGSVILNGTNLRVDVEELSEEEADRLTKRRRVKASLIPYVSVSILPSCRPGSI